MPTTPDAPPAVLLVWEDGTQELSGWSDFLKANADEIPPGDLDHLIAGRPVTFGGGAAPEVTVYPVRL